jgi:hypothetical protein
MIALVSLATRCRVDRFIRWTDAFIRTSRAFDRQLARGHSRRARVLLKRMGRIRAAMTST